MDTYDFLADPRAITLQERRATAVRLAQDQQHWLQRLQGLCEAPPPERDFPAFLLATPAFAELAARLGTATARRQLPLAVADELDWFVAAFRDYLRTVDGEDVFSSSSSDRSARG
jgi:hypothetical protein